MAPSRHPLFGIRPFAICSGRGIIRPMRNGLYSLHMTMIEAPGKGSAVLVARDGTILGGNGHVWFSGAYTFDERGRWKGELTTAPYALIGNRSLPFESETV